MLNANEPHGRLLVTASPDRSDPRVIIDWRLDCSPAEAANLGRALLAAADAARHGYDPEHNRAVRRREARACLRGWEGEALESLCGRLGVKRDTGEPDELLRARGFIALNAGAEP